MPNAVLPHFDGFKYELNPVIRGYNNSSPFFSSFCSLKGRFYCLINIVGHGLGCVVKPVVYTVKALANCIFAILAMKRGNKERAQEYGWKALNDLGSALITPFTQPIQVVRAAFGCIFHPRVYYTKVPEQVKVKCSNRDYQIGFDPNETKEDFKRRVASQLNLSMDKFQINYGRYPLQMEGLMSPDVDKHIEHLDIIILP